MFKQDEAVVADHIPAKDLIGPGGLGLAIQNRVGRVVEDPPRARTKPHTEIVGYTDVDFRDPNSKDDAPMVYRVSRSWLSRAKVSK